MIRARVFSEVYAERVWAYEIIDDSRPEGFQMRSSGLRRTWRSALAEANDRLRAVPSPHDDGAATIGADGGSEGDQRGPRRRPAEA
jgi:hypothetical protein